MRLEVLVRGGVSMALCQCSNKTVQFNSIVVLWSSSWSSWSSSSSSSSSLMVLVDNPRPQG